MDEICHYWNKLCDDLIDFKSQVVSMVFSALFGPDYFQQHDIFLKMGHCVNFSALNDTSAVAYYFLEVFKDKAKYTWLSSTRSMHYSLRN